MTLQRCLTGFRSELWVHSLSSLFGWKTLHCWRVNFQPHLRLRCSRSGLHLPVLASPLPRCLSVGMELGWWFLVLGDTSNCIQMLQSWAHQIRKMCFSHCQGPSGVFLQTLDELSEVWEETICLPNGVLGWLLPSWNFLPSAPRISGAQSQGQVWVTSFTQILPHRRCSLWSDSQLLLFESSSISDRRSDSSLRASWLLCDWRWL